MKKSFLFIVAIGTAFLIIISSPSNVHSNISGAPAGRTGSPGDNGATCNSSGCHSGSPVVVNNDIISSDVPASGYVPGATYNFDVTVAQTGINRYGFQISPQNAAGDLQGAMIVTNATETKLISSGKYITHRQAGVAGTGNSRTWTFQWTAPIGVTINEVTFYGAINAANGTGSATGDRIITTQYTVPRDQDVGIFEPSNPLSLGIFPNPLTEGPLTLDFVLQQKESVNVQLFGIDGSFAGELYTSALNPGRQKITVNTGAISGGIYLVVLQAGAQTSVARIIKR